MLALGSIATLLTLYPYYTPLALTIGVSLTIAGTFAAICSHRSYDYWARAAYGNSWLLLFLGTAIRAWTDVIPVLWFWFVLLMTLYLVAWAFPVLHPKLSALLFREQFAPETRLGRGCMAWALALLPVIGGLGATFGMYGSRNGLDNIVSLVMAILGSIISIGLSQVFSHQLWPQRPWTKDDGEPQEKV